MGQACARSGAGAGNILAVFLVRRFVSAIFLARAFFGTFLVFAAGHGVTSDKRAVRTVLDVSGARLHRPVRLGFRDSRKHETRRCGKYHFFHHSLLDFQFGACCETPEYPFKIVVFTMPAYKI